MVLPDFYRWQSDSACNTFMHIFDQGNHWPMAPVWSQEKFIKAHWFAAAAHNGQLVPGTELPYIVHLDQVCMEIFAALGAAPAAEPDLAVQCALLHDTVEDTAVTPEELETEFGSAVSEGVMALTIDDSIGAGLEKFDQRWLQLEDYLERILRQPREIWMVKMADRITNLQPPPSHWTAAMIDRYRKGALLILDKLGSSSSFLGLRLESKIKRYPAKYVDL